MGHLRKINSKKQRFTSIELSHMNKKYKKPKYNREKQTRHWKKSLIPDKPFNSDTTQKKIWFRDQNATVDREHRRFKHATREVLSHPKMSTRGIHWNQEPMCIMDHNVAFANKTSLVSQGLCETLGFAAHIHELTSDMVAKQLEQLKAKRWRSPRGFRQQGKNEDGLADFAPEHTCPCDLARKVCARNTTTSVAI